MFGKICKTLISLPLFALLLFGIGLGCLIFVEQVFAEVNSQTETAKKTEKETCTDGDETKRKKRKKDEVDISHEVVVVAKRVPVNPFKTDRTVTVLNEQSMREQHPRTLPEALYETPGTFVQETNQGGGSPIIRGMIGPQLLITVNGVRFNNSTFRTGPGQYLNLIDPLSVERVEILRGPGSVLYGSDAMGGVIQVSPLSMPVPSGGNGTVFNANLLTRYNSANAGIVTHGRLEFGSENFSFLGGATVKKFGDLRGGKGVGMQPYLGYDHLSAVGETVYRFSNELFEGWSLSAGYLLSRIDGAGRTDKLYNKNSLQIYDNDDHLIYTQLKMLYPGIRTEGKLILSYHGYFERKDSIKVENDYKTPIKTTRDEVSAGTLGVDINMTTWLKKDKLRLAYGGMWYRDVVDAERFTQNVGEGWLDSSVQSYPDNSNYSNYGIYSHLDWTPVTWLNGHSVQLGVGGRLHGMSAYTPATGDLAALDFSHRGFVFLANIQYLFGDISNIAFTFSQGFRSPNLQEAAMLGDAGSYFHIPNYDLGPERSDTFELVARTRLGPLLISWSGYMSSITDLIKRDFTQWNGLTEVDGKEVVNSINGGKGIIYGTEGFLLLEIGKGFSAAGHATYTWGNETFTGGGGEPLSRIPPLFGQFKIRYDFYRFLGRAGFLETYIRGAARQDRLSARDIKDNRIPDGGTPGWLTLNFRTGINVSKQIRLVMILDNIFNKKYKYHGSGIYNAGTNFTFTVEIFGR